jgi:hypothetical protein
VPLIRARPVMRTQPLIPNTLGELEMMRVMLVNAKNCYAGLDSRCSGKLKLEFHGGERLLEESGSWLRN